MYHDKEPESGDREGDVAEMSESEIDLNLIQTFPASDPPSWTLGIDHQDENSGNQSGDENEADD